MTAAELALGAAQDLGIIAAGQSLRGQDQDDIIASLNVLTDSLGLDRGLLQRVVRTQKTLTASTATYTIGAGASIDLDVPSRIVRAGLVNDITATDPLETPIEVLTAGQYADWGLKSTEGQPSAVWFDPTTTAVTGYGLVYPLPVPDLSTYALVLYTPGGALAAWDAENPDTEVVAPRGYSRLFRKLLSLEIAPMFPSAVVSPLLLRQAASAKQLVDTTNLRVEPRQNDPTLDSASLRSGFSGRWNIETDGWR